MSYAPISMSVPKLNLSDLVKPEEEGKTYIGPNVNWGAIPGFLSDLLGLADPTGMVGNPGLTMAPLGLEYLMSRTAKNLWNEPKLKVVRDLIKNIYKETEVASPVTKDVLSNTRLIFDDPRTTSSLMMSNIFDNIIRLIPKDVLKSLPEDKLIPLLKTATGHETRHFLIGDPIVYSYVSERFKGLPPVVKKVLENSVPPEQVKNIMEKFPKDKAKAMLDYIHTSELYAYAKEALEQGNQAYSPIAKSFAYLAQQSPEFNTILNQVGGIPAEMAKGAKESIEAMRKGGRGKFIESLGFTTEEIRKSIIEAQRPVISTKSRGVIRPKTAKAREVPMVEEPKAVVKGRTREYIPTESSKTKSIKLMYSSPVDPNKEFADDVVKGIKDARIRDKAWQLIMEHLSTQP